ncbi:uridine kinase [Virgisporangium aliadipatigenens]|uniref:Uridine kinase n=2 Tax=Virgisporangium aliadipatigenens TaxID=741659 RepID=A0A8J4DPB3_9ACTN|nr:uridine kinase [Virgisporangium aliadipatigenens]
MRYEPLSPERMIEHLADAIAERATDDARVRVGIDGPPAAAPGSLARSLVGPLRLRGLAAFLVEAADFVRPASIRYELGRTNPDAFYDTWFDLSALRREVLDPAGPGGTGKILETFWDPVRDRATRAPYTELPERAVVLLSGPLLLGAGLPLEYTVHLVLTPPALERRTPPEERWTLPAYARYAEEVDPTLFADAVIRYDHPTRPALRVDH